MKTMIAWHAYFASRIHDLCSVSWNSEVKDTEFQQIAVARSLSHFQLGENGEGLHIRGLALAYAQKRRVPEYALAVDFFVREENKHARLLAEAVAYLQGSLVQTHWTETVFILLRRSFTLALEVQILACAEIIGLIFYRFLKEKSKDSSIRAMCDIFLIEEREHLHFDADALSWMMHGSSSWIFSFFARFLFTGALVAAWIDHGSCLRSFGVSFFDWLRSGFAEYTQFARRRDVGMA